MGAITIKKSLLALLFVCCIALVISNVLLARRNAQLRRVDDQLNSSNRLEFGSEVPPIVGYDASGKKVTYTYGEDSRETLYLIFSPACHACDENWSNWNRLMKGLNSRTTRVVVANLATGLPVTSEYIAKHAMSGVPLITELSPESMLAYHLLYTPQTILIGRDGRVRKVETGAIQVADFVQEVGCSPSSSVDCAPNTVPMASLSR